MFKRYKIKILVWMRMWLRSLCQKVKRWLHLTGTWHCFCETQINLKFIKSKVIFCCDSRWVFEMWFVINKQVFIWWSPGHSYNEVKDWSPNLPTQKNSSRKNQLHRLLWNALLTQICADCVEMRNSLLWRFMKNVWQNK